MDLRNLDQYVTSQHEEGYPCSIILELNEDGDMWIAKVVDCREKGVLLDLRGEKYMQARATTATEAIRWLNNLAA